MINRVMISLHPNGRKFKVFFFLKMRKRWAFASCSDRKKTHVKNNDVQHFLYWNWSLSSFEIQKVVLKYGSSKLSIDIKRFKVLF